MTFDSYLSTVKNLARQVEEASLIRLSGKVSPGISKVVVSGVGGSAIAGDVLKSYMHRSKVPVFVCRSYDLPEFVDSGTLVFSVSYSGNTEETLSAVKKAFGKGAQVVAVSSGGKLIQQFVSMGRPYIKLPQGLQPRASLAYQLIPMLSVLSELGVIPDASKEITDAINSLRALSDEYDRRASALAGKLLGKVPLIYASERFASVAYRWKTQLNENAKIHAFANFFSELNHNEVVGYSSLNANYHVVILEDEFDHKRIKSRMQLTRSLISSKGVSSTHIRVSGDSMLTRLLSAIYIGDLVSVHLAGLENIDPEPVELIEGFKKELERIPNI